MTELILASRSQAILSDSQSQTTRWVQGAPLDLWSLSFYQVLKFIEHLFLERRTGKVRVGLSQTRLTGFMVKMIARKVAPLLTRIGKNELTLELTKVGERTIFFCCSEWALTRAARCEPTDAHRRRRAERASPGVPSPVRGASRDVETRARSLLQRPC